MNPARLDFVRTLVAQLEALQSAACPDRNLRRQLCLANAGDDGYTLAPPTSPAAQCEQVETVRRDAQQRLAPVARLRETGGFGQQRTGPAIELELVRDRANGWPFRTRHRRGDGRAVERRGQSNNSIEISIVERWAAPADLRRERLHRG